jgi:hypothetical protein
MKQIINSFLLFVSNSIPRTNPQRFVTSCYQIHKSISSTDEQRDPTGNLKVCIRINTYLYKKDVEVIFIP